MTQAEIFADLKRRRYESEEEGWTTTDYAANLGISDGSARRQVREGVRDGTIRCVGRKLVGTPDGRANWLPSYLFVNASPAEKTADNREKAATSSGARPVLRRRNG